MPEHLFSCESGWEIPLAEELGRVFPGSKCTVRPGGWIGIDAPANDLPGHPCVALARQMLPAAEEVRAASISRWAGWCGNWLIEQLAGHDGPWRWHLFVNPHPQATTTASRVALIADEAVKLLKKKQRRLLRSRVESDQGLPAADERLMQLALIEPDRGYASNCSLAESAQWSHCVSRFAGGMVGVRAPREAPSRAMEKLAEAELRLGRQILPGETCVDLGSSPGSWAWHALQRQAKVVAIDRSPLRADLMNHPRLEFIRGDAFAYRPPQPVDWLLCDVIAFPQRTLDLLIEWLSEGWCRHFCVTIKFRGTSDYPLLEQFKAELFRLAESFCLRRFTSNKNEVMAVGQAASRTKASRIC